MRSFPINWMRPLGTVTSTRNVNAAVIAFRLVLRLSACPAFHNDGA
jgi:hypothetical protein